jgi:hypothetical protein
MYVNQDENQAQAERTERARSAILAGKFMVTRIDPRQWTVKNGDKLPYVVSLKSTPSNDDPGVVDVSVGNDWTCTCMDFQQRGPHILCKHIEGVRLLEAAQDQIPPLTKKENHMNNATPSNAVNPGDRLNQILTDLRQPLDMSRVKRRQSPGSGTVPYLEGFDIIERANHIFGFAWSFDLIAQPVIVRWHKNVLIWNQQEKRKVPLIDASGSFQTEEVGLVYITGKVTVDLDGKLYSHADLGRCVFTGDTPEALDMALAGSATDCLKRCFRQLGEQFGNKLYDKEIAQNAGLEPKRTNGKASSPGGQPSRSTASTGTSSSPAVRKYADGVGVNGNASEQEAFDRFKEKTGKAPATKDELRTWLASQRSTTTPASVAA